MGHGAERETEGRRDGGTEGKRDRGKEGVKGRKGEGEVKYYKRQKLKKGLVGPLLSFS